MRIVNLSHPETELWDHPKALVVYTTQSDTPAELSPICARYPDMTVFGVSSFHGMLMHDGFKRGTWGMLFEAADRFDMRAMVVDLQDVTDVRSAVRDATLPWKQSASGSRQFMIHATQGKEERIIEGLSDTFGDAAEIFGATAGNDRFLDHGYVFLGEKKLTCGVLIVQMMKPHLSCMVTRGGYLTTLRQGVLTSAKGRILKTIDNRPAATVYNEWTDGRFDAYVSRGGDLPRSAGMYPLAHMLSSEPECGSWLVHPHSVDTTDMSLHVFAEIPENTPISLMRGSQDSIINRMKAAARQALDQVNRDDIQAAFIMFCAGCASIVAENMQEVCDQASAELKDIPFMGCLSLGEQGRLSHAHRNYHGNMMISLIFVMKSDRAG